MKQEMIVWQWHQLDLVQIICSSLQTTTYSVFTGLMSKHWRQVHSIKSY